MHPAEREFQCVSCHKLNGVGDELGPALTESGTTIPGSSSISPIL
jgi:hypothetical protein